MPVNISADKSINRYLIAAISLCFIALSIYVRIRLLATPLERDEGEYAYMAQLLLKGIPPYTLAYTMKLPGVALFYAFFMALFGQSIEGIRIGLILVNTASVLMVYLLGRRLFNNSTSFIAAAFYAIISLSHTVQGVFAHATHFVVLFSMAGIILLHRAVERKTSPLIFAAGLMFGIAVLMKQHAAVMIPFALVYRIWPQKDKGNGSFGIGCLTLLTGAAMPYLGVIIWMSAAGVFDSFRFWTLSYASAYATGLSLPAGLAELAREGSKVLHSTFPVFTLAVAGITAIAIKWKSCNGRLLLPGYLLASVIMLAQGFYFRPHYFILLLPAISLLAASGLGSITEYCQSSKLRLTIPLTLLALALLYPLLMERDYLFMLSPTETSRKIYGTNPFPEALRIADYLRSQTTANDRIAILGSEPEILFYADRLSATGHIYMYGVMENHRYAEKMQSRLISDIETTAPKFIVVAHIDASWLLRPHSINKILDWGDSYIPLRYDEVGIVDILGYAPTRYLLGVDTTGYQPESDSFVSIFRRR